MEQDSRNDSGSSSLGASHAIRPKVASVGGSSSKSEDTANATNYASSEASATRQPSPSVVTERLPRDSRKRQRRTERSSTVQTVDAQTANSETAAVPHPSTSSASSALQSIRLGRGSKFSSKLSCMHALSLAKPQGCDWDWEFDRDASYVIHFWCSHSGRKRVKCKAAGKATLGDQGIW